MKTSDIYFGAALMALGASYERADRENPRHLDFYFSVPLDMAFDFEDAEKQWTNQTLMVNAVKYKSALQQLKSVVHSR